MSSVPSDQHAAVTLFEEFLERYHEGETDFDELCRTHPEHEESFQRWWGHLIRSREVTESSSAEADSAWPTPGGMFGAYKVERELGRGSQGTVFLAQDTRLSRQVALKILPGYRSLSSAKTERFAREAELASRLDHPGLCTVYERGVSGSLAFLAMRYVEGATLSSILARERRRAEVAGRDRAVRLAPDAELAERDAIHAMLVFFEKVADALHAAHEARLIHRDVKPGNILVDTAGDPVIADFGLARDPDSEVLTITGDLVGTPAYMSPEQLAAQRIELDRRTDVYSLGVALFECLTLHRPFDAPTTSQLYQMILTREPHRPREFNPEISRDLEIVLMTAIERDREQRYQSARDLAEDLRRVRELQPIRARPAGPLLRFKRWAQRNRAIAVTLTLLFLSLTFGLVVSLSLHAMTLRSRAALERLGDIVQLEEAERAARGLFPARHQTAAIGVWLRDHGQPLVDRLPEHEAQLLALRERALDYTDADRQRDRDQHPDRAEIEPLEREVTTYRGALELDPVELVRRRILWRLQQKERQIAAIRAALGERRTWRFDRIEDQIAHDSLTRLVADLKAFETTGTYARLAADHAFGSSLHERRQRDAALWRRTQAAIAKSTHYGGANLAVQPGLVPLGASPRSGLQEFAVLRSGNVPSRHEETGTLLVDESSAIVLVLIPGGEHVLGLEPASMPPRFEPLVYERFRRRVKLGWFFLAKHEVTRGQWRRLGGDATAISADLAGNDCDGDGFPVDAVSWVACRAWLQRHGMGFPTEAQWEYAARGGDRTRIRAIGNERPMGERQLLNVLDQSYCTLIRSPSSPKFDDGAVLTAPVWTMAGNPFGLLHMDGNVREWCRESFQPIRLSAVPIVGDEGEHRMPAPAEDIRSVRGSAYDTRLARCYVGRRDGLVASAPHVAVGLRPMRRVE